MKELTFNIEENKNIYFSSDSHYGHKNLCRGTSNWNNLDGTRNFNTVKEMNDTIVSEINNVVGENDVFFFLGDFAFGGYQNIYNFRKQLNCREIYIILGNHDDHIRNNKKIEIDDSSIEFAQNLFSGVYETLKIKINSDIFVLYHFPILEWEDKDKGSKHLFGHVHGNDPNIENAFDMGVDNIFKFFGRYRPLSYKEIKEIFN